jgi:hypothetical protein
MAKKGSRDLNEMTASAVVLRGHLIVTLPILLLTAISAEAFSFFIGPPATGAGAAARFLYLMRMPAGALIGSAAGWMWWSYAIPRWRMWWLEIGADEEQVQSLAQRTLLIWPKGSVFEKTEFRSHTPLE